MQIGYLISDLNQLADVAAWGYAYAEATPGLLDPDFLDVDADTQAADAVLARLQTAPLPITSLCGFMPDPEVNGLMVVGPDVDPVRLRAYVTRLFDTMQRAGIDVIGYGSGASRWAPPGFATDRALAQVCEFLQLCDELGRPRGVRVALEPYNRDDANLLNTVAEALNLVQQVNLPHCQLMADFFHMRLNGEEMDELLAAGPHLIHAHIAEPGRGRPQTTPAEHAHFLQTLRRAGYDGRVTQTGDLPAYRSPAAAAASLKRAAGAT
ncbi:MAG: sugar phosphate isomerase/epimerase family protein [Caldilineaceae bacterium]